MRLGPVNSFLFQIGVVSGTGSKGFSILPIVRAVGFSIPSSQSQIPDPDRSVSWPVWSRLAIVRGWSPAASPRDRKYKLCQICAELRYFYPVVPVHSVNSCLLSDSTDRPVSVTCFHLSPRYGDCGLPFHGNSRCRLLTSTARPVSASSLSSTTGADSIQRVRPGSATGRNAETLPPSYVWWPSPVRFTVTDLVTHSFHHDKVGLTD